MITVRRVVVGNMSAALFGLALLGFLLGALDPFFRPLVWISLGSGALVAIALWARHRRSSHPTVSHLEPDPDAGKPIHPK